MVKPGDMVLVGPWTYGLDSEWLGSDRRDVPMVTTGDGDHIGIEGATVVPFSDALPALCQWFLETPWSFEMAAGLLMAFSEQRPPFPPYLEALRALVVALAPFDPDADALTAAEGAPGGGES